MCVSHIASRCRSSAILRTMRLASVECASFNLVSQLQEFGLSVDSSSLLRPLQLCEVWRVRSGWRQSACMCAVTIKGKHTNRHLCTCNHPTCSCCRRVHCCGSRDEWTVVHVGCCEPSLLGLNPRSLAVKRTVMATNEDEGKLLSKNMGRHVPNSCEQSFSCAQECPQH